MTNPAYKKVTKNFYFFEVEVENKIKEYEIINQFKNGSCVEVIEVNYHPFHNLSCSGTLSLNDVGLYEWWWHNDFSPESANAIRDYLNTHGTPFEEDINQNE